LTEEEAANIATATKNVARHYPSLVASEKILDWTMLLWALGSTYGMRVYLSMPEKKKAKSSDVSNTVTFPYDVEN
jgi:hypothetical protein